MRLELPRAIIAATISAALIPNSESRASSAVATSPAADVFDDTERHGADLKDVGIHDEGDSESSNQTIEIRQQEEWSEECNERFHDLSIKEALDEISEPELAELEHLSRLRRKDGRPRSIDEIIAELRHWRAATRLLSSLKTYVTVIEPGGKGSQKARS